MRSENIGYMVQAGKCVEKVSLICATCGESFKKYACQLLEPADHRFCSRKCQMIFLKKLYVEKVKNTFEKRFWARVHRGEGCWNWIGSVTSAGYGGVGRNRQRFQAHRIAYELMVGRIPNGMYVLHKCDNRRCVNPDHLYIGTHADNMRDASDRHRFQGRGGENNGRAKLTDESVAKIRQLYASGGYHQVVLAEMFGVCQAHISRIVRGELR